MWFQKPQLQETAHREAVLRNLLPLLELCKCRGGEIEYDVKWSTDRSEKLLWSLVNGLAKRARLDFPDGMSCEDRISAIRRNLPAIPRRGQGHPWLQEIKDCPFFRR
jgi:hypothetical protein